MNFYALTEAAQWVGGSLAAIAVIAIVCTLIKHFFPAPPPVEGD